MSFAPMHSILLALAFTPAHATGRSAVPHSIVDLDGHPVDPLAAPDAHAVVLVFVATDCPVSNRYIPELQRLQHEFASNGVHFWLVYPNPADTAAVVRAHDAEFSLSLPSALDTTQALVHQAHATTTPEATIFVPLSSADAAAAGVMREVYRGRIDDRYLSFGHERPQAQHHDLEDALHAVLTHRPVTPPDGGPVGCAIVPLHL